MGMVSHMDKPLYFIKKFEQLNTDYVFPSVMPLQATRCHCTCICATYATNDGVALPLTIATEELEHVHNHGQFLGGALCIMFKNHMRS